MCLAKILIQDVSFSIVIGTSPDPQVGDQHEQECFAFQMYLQMHFDPSLFFSQIRLVMMIILFRKTSPATQHRELVI
jgi:hypothetical protein